MSDGIDAAHGALSIIQNAMPRDRSDGPTLDEFAADLAHIDLDKQQARRAIAYLAVQVWVERRSTDKRAAADATRTLDHIIGELERWRGREQNRKDGLT